LITPQRFRRGVNPNPSARGQSQAVVDTTAAAEGWTRSSKTRSFVVEHWEYDGQYVNTWDYDIGAVHVSRDRAATEAALDEVLARHEVVPAAFDYPWHTGDPKG
jgi:hypothetical protein